MEYNSAGYDGVGRPTGPYTVTDKGNRSSVESDPGEIVFEEKVRSLRDVVSNCKYPFIAKIQKGDVSKYVPDGVAPGNDGNVLHVLEVRRHKMLVATKLQWDRKTGDYQQTDKQIEINVTQKGWFEVLPDNGQPVEYFDTINAIVGTRPKQFLVRTSVVGYQLSIENGTSCWMPWEIKPGEVLTTGIVHMDQKKVKRKGLFKRIFSSGKSNMKKEQDLKYLQCFDSENREIMVPLIMTGVFSPVGYAASHSYDAVYALHDLVMAFNLPIKAQLIHTDAQTYDNIPSGVLQLDRIKDHECLLVTNHPFVENESVTFEIPVCDDIYIAKERKKKLGKKSSIVNDEPAYDSSKLILSTSQVDLPIRVKDPKRSKSSSILEKLSVRSKARKERASLKALQEAGIFSSRLSKSDLNYEDVDAVSNSDTIESPTDDAVIASPGISINDYSTDRPASKRDVDEANGYGVIVKRSTMLDRDLPPIPKKTRSPRRGNYDKEGVYEELPVAPRPPMGQHRAGFYIENDDTTERAPDDGYMTPAQLRELSNASDSRNESGLVVKRKPPAAPPRDSIRYTKARRAKGDYQTSQTYENDPGEQIDSMFDFGYTDDPVSENAYERRRQTLVGPYATPVRGNAFDENNYQIRRRLNSFEEPRKFRDDTSLEQKQSNGFPKFKSKSQRNLHVEANATIRSHNTRKMRTAMEVFTFSDSLRDLRQPMSSNDQITDATYGRVMDSERVKSYVYGDQSQNTYARPGIHYAESEPAFRKYHRSPSIAALSDSFPKHGDDSAISLCSRGEYGGFNGESEYSYSEYSHPQEDGWIPPDEIGNLSVLEISKSLRYIGMKDRVVIRFAHEQIDGNMLCSLDKKLLLEGFPELNALEIKKILDFVGGWRPKK